MNQVNSELSPHPQVVVEVGCPVHTCHQSTTANRR